MELRRFFHKVLILTVFSPNLCWAQSLSVGEGNKDIEIRRHLTYESNKGDSILYFKGYSVIYSYTYNLPRYVFSVLTPDQLISQENRPPVKRSNSYFPYTLPNGSLSATNVDYIKSGYDRGHLVPAGDYVWNKELKDETFFYVNISPQKPALNRGIWANLENRIRSVVLRLGEDAHVVTGVVFNPRHEEKIGPNGIRVPIAFFKIIYFDNQNKMFAFLFDNSIDHLLGSITDFQVSVDFIELITGEDFFDLIDDKFEDIMESKIYNFNEYIDQ